MAVFLIISTYLLILVDPSRAWTNIAGITPKTTPISRVRNALVRASPAPPAPSSASSSALNYNNGNQLDEEYSPGEYFSNRGMINDELDTEIRLQVALQTARDADRRYGLCTPESIRAWQLVDDIYMSSSASRQIEDNVKKVLGGEKSIWSSFERSYV